MTDVLKWSKFLDIDGIGCSYPTRQEIMSVQSNLLSRLSLNLIGHRTDKMNQPIHIHELFTYEKVSTRDYKLKAKPLPELIGYEPKTPTPNQIKVNGKTLDTYSDVFLLME